MIGVFIEIEKRCGFHAFDVASVRNEIEVELKDLILAVFHFKLNRAKHFNYLADDVSLPGLKRTGDLHSDRASPGCSFHPNKIPESRPNNRQWIHTGMGIKVPVLLRDDGLSQQR